nr:MAG TPA: hypothetical protein [Caudoviricetes sp.]
MRADEVYAMLKKRIEQGGVTDEAIKKIVEQYFEEHPVQITTDSTLSIAGMPADAKATGGKLNGLEEKTNSLKEDINNLKSSSANNESLIVIYDILSKGTYTEDISPLMSQLDGLVHDGMYKITSDVKNATLSNKSNYVAKGSKYTCTVTASLGYKISAVVVTMGGVDISNSYDTTTKTVTIESVTGNVNITVTTIESDYTSLQYIKGDGNSWIDTGYADSKCYKQLFVN